MTAATTTPPHLKLVAGGEPAEGVLPPHDLDAEAAVLSAVMITGQPGMVEPGLIAIRSVKSFLRPEHFYSEAHRRIFEAALALHEASQPVDVGTVGSWLKSRDRISQVGGMGYLTEVLNAAPSIARANVRAYAVTVHEHWRARMVILTCQRVSALGYVDYGDAQAYVDDAMKALSRIAVKNPIKPIETNEVACKRVMHEWTGITPEGTAPISGFPTGIFRLDELVGGLMPGRKITLAAMPGVGKTLLAMQMAVHIAKQGIGVLFFTSEMERWELVGRAVQAESKVRSDRIKSRKLSQRNIDDLTQASSTITSLPIRIDDNPNLNVEDVEAIVANMADEFPLTMRVPLGVVIVDYVQRLEPTPSFSRSEEHHQIANSTKRLKNMAKERHVAVLEVAQAKVDPKDVKRGKWRPTVQSGIAGCQRVGKESDDAIFICEDGADPTEDPRDMTLWVPKQRNGKRGEVPVRFYGSYLRFEDPNAPMTAERHHVAAAELGDGRPYEPTHFSTEDL